MRTSIAAILVAAAIIAGLTGCETAGLGGRTAGGSPPILDAGWARASGFSAEEISAANNLTLAKCVRCHQFYDPARYQEAEWNVWMKKMGKKAKLKPDQNELLSRYFAAYRKLSTERKTAP